jgi:hypothetical protein
MKMTTDHEEIRAWAEKYAGSPQLLDHPNATADTPGIRLDFPGEDDDVFLSEETPPQDVTWEVFFEHFDQMKLAFMYNDTKDTSIDPSSDYRFVKRTSQK